MDLSYLLSDTELGGSAFTVIRETWRKRYGESILLSTLRAEGVIGNIQPASSEDIALFPQEERTEGIIQILSYFAFSVGFPDSGDGTFVVPDMIHYLGNKYKVIKVKDWSLAGGFYKAWAVRQKSNE